MSIELANHQDLIQPFLIHHSSVRGRIVRLGKSVDAILSQHAYPPAVSPLLAEMCVLAAMLSSNLKGRGKLTMQIRGDGDIAFMVVDVKADGALRGYAEMKEGAIFEDSERSMKELVGKGYLAITLQKGKKPYQGIVELDGESIGDSMQHYFSNSEQSVVYVKTSVGKREVNGESVWVAGGVMIQQVPQEGGTQEETLEQTALEDKPENLIEDWNHNRVLAMTVKEEELLDVYLSPQALLYRLYNEDGVWVYDAEAFRAECSCSREKVIQTLAQFPEEELEGMLGDDAKLEVKCQFCSNTESFTMEEFS
ncbi:MAG: Hsp33 family molecular chaperone HslO [Rickettsiales bacterium]|nr:Hsp33 family molecular chaperone HslO [Rickettsiales bacterium]